MCRSCNMRKCQLIVHFWREGGCLVMSLCQHVQGMLVLLTSMKLVLPSLVTGPVPGPAKG